MHIDDNDEDGSHGGGYDVADDNDDDDDGVKGDDGNTASGTDYGRERDDAYGAREDGAREHVWDSYAAGPDGSVESADASTVWTSTDADGAAEEVNAEMQEVARAAAAQAAEENPDGLTAADVSDFALQQRPKAMTMRFDVEHVRRRSAETDAAAAAEAAAGDRR
jgi:hypothetical protein